MTEFLAFLRILPDLVSLIKQFMVWINHVSGNDPQGFIKSVGEAFQKLNVAETPEERKDAAKSIATVISRL